MAEATDLRRKMRAAGATYKVTKNRLTNLALDGTPFDGIKPLLKGPIALAWSMDPVAVAKTAVEFARTNEKFVVVGGALGTQTLNADGIKALAELPSLNELRARIVGMISTPATRVAGVLQGAAGQLVRVFGAFARKDEASAEAALSRECDRMAGNPQANMATGGTGLARNQPKSRLGTYENG